MKPRTRALVVGCGSIGRRHLRNLQSLGLSVLAFDPQPARAAAAAAESGAKTVASLSAGLKLKPDLAVIATPSSLHLGPALAAAKAGAALFIEKPVSHTLEGLEALESVVEKKGLVALVACNMRFHPGLATVRRLLSEGAIGRPLNAGIICASYLPDWHPGEDYRKGYSARADLGGGALLDCIHELDYMLDMLGAAEAVSAELGNSGALGIETEETADLAVRLRSGALAQLHLDYVSRSPARGCRIEGSDGVVDWLSGVPEVRLSRRGRTESIPIPIEDPNAMYLAMTRHLVDCLEGRARPAQGLKEARAALELALAAKRSSAEGRRVLLPRAARTVGVIQARMGSKRLPGKVLTPLAGKSALSRMIGRASRALSLDLLVVATSVSPSDDAVAAEAARCGAKVFRGSEPDVLDRFYRAAAAWGATTVVRLTGDCPLVDPAVVDRIVAAARKAKLGYVATGKSYPDGLDVEVVPFSTLETAWKEAALPSDREHVLPYVWKQPERFGVKRLEYARDCSKLRLTLDEPADRELIDRLFAALGDEFTLERALAWLAKHPKIARLNRGIARNEGYQLSLAKERG